MGAGKIATPHQWGGWQNIPEWAQANLLKTRAQRVSHRTHATLGANSLTTVAVQKLTPAPKIMIACVGFGQHMNEQLTTTINARAFFLEQVIPVFPSPAAGLASAHSRPLCCLEKPNEPITHHHR
jgi:hypothetical protein